MGQPPRFFEFHGTPGAVAEQTNSVSEIAHEHGALGFEVATRTEDRSRLWTARDNTLYAGLGLKPGSRAVITDVCVPVSRLAEGLVETRQDLDRADLLAPIVGHVGDGNFHVLILVDPDDPRETQRAREVHRRMVERAIAFDGTCTGEHGVGIGKMEFLEGELGDAVDVMRAVKLALDPHNIMNPGKIFSL